MGKRFNTPVWITPKVKVSLRSFGKTPSSKASPYTSEKAVKVKVSLCQSVQLGRDNFHRLRFEKHIAQKVQWNRLENTKSESFDVNVWVT